MGCCFLMRLAQRWYIRAILVFVALVFSIISLCVNCPRIFTKDNLGFDYMGVIVGALSFLVVFTVSWQIINAMEVKKELDKATSERKELNEEMNKRLMSIVSDVCGYMGDIAEMVSKRDNAHWEYFITSIKSYNKYRESGNGVMTNIAKSNIIESVNMELYDSGGFLPQLTFCIQLVNSLKIKDVTPLQSDIEREKEKSKDDNNLLNLIEVLIRGINNRNEMQRKVQEQKRKEQQEQSAAKTGSDSTSSDEISEEEPRETSDVSKQL